MKRTSTFLPVVIACVLMSCNKNNEATTTVTTANAKTYAEIEKASWLLGSWGNTSPEGILSEKWIKTNDSILHGESYFVVNKDTVFSENIQLEEADGKLAYIVTMPGQNNEKPVRFDMTVHTDKQIVFENPAHDFPNKIAYNKITNDSLVAEISGLQKGKPTSETFIMAREK
jgi:hypothetical protein